MKRVLLISPATESPETEMPQPHAALANLNFLDAKAFMTPLALATVAALTPEDVEIDIWDETVRGVIGDSADCGQDYDLVGITGYEAHLERVMKLGQVFRDSEIPVAVGGAGVSAAPERYRNHFDILFVGEAEYIWPQFIADWQDGGYRAEYRQVTRVDVAHSPPPRWDKVAADVRYYLTGGVQTTRGCPFDCEFCDVIYLHGRRPRHKPIDQVLVEVSALERLGVHRIGICDDNFVGDPPYSRRLLKELISLNRSFTRPVEFTTQAALTVAEDDEMLELLADANFAGLVIGLESPNIDSLIETNKPQNVRTDIVPAVKKIHTYGIPVRATMVVGFDHDDTSIFEAQFEFLQQTGIPNPGVNVLQAPVGTKLWIRLHKEGRLIQLGNLKPAMSSTHETNIIPKRMTRVELLSGYATLVARLREWDNFEARVKEMLSQVQRKPLVRARRQSFGLTIRFLTFVFLSLDRRARRTIFHLVVHTRRQAPWLLKTVLRLICQQYLEAVRLPDVLEAIERQIRCETAEGFQLQREQVNLLVPDGFKEPYKAIFPEMYERMWRCLADKTRIPDALIEVIYEFLIRWGVSFLELEDHHRTFLYELCERTIVRENGSCRQSAGAAGRREAAESTDVATRFSQRLDNVRLDQLADGVLHCVEQWLRASPPRLADCTGGVTS